MWSGIARLSALCQEVIRESGETAGVIEVCDRQCKAGVLYFGVPAFFFKKCVAWAVK